MDTRLTKRDQQFVFAFLIGLMLRLLAIPFSMPNEADAVTRIFIAENWMLKPELISYGVWGPLHTYLIAGMLYLWNDPIHAPVLLNCLFSAAVAIPLYLFVKREWNETAALFTACLYLAYPVAFRFGLVALTEVPFIFFMALALLMLSYARDETGDWKYALWAGAFITVAGSLRYEAWGLTPFLGLLLWKQWKKLFVFLAVAALFPIFWLAGNYLHFGDPLYSFHWSTDWNLNIGAANADVSTIDIINRLVYFPRALVFGLTPLAFLACFVGAILIIYKRSRQWIWLIPFFALFAVFTVNAVNGSLTTQVRYSLELGIFLVPFSAEWFDSLKNPSRRLLFAVIVIASMLPLSYLRAMIPWPFDFPHPVPNKIEAIPRVDPSVVRLSEFELQQSQVYPGGLLLDFSDWGDTYYIAIMSRKHASDVFIMPGEVNEKMDMVELNNFFTKNPTGIVLLTEAPRFMQLEQGERGLKLKITGYEKTFSVESLGEVEGNRFYKYSVDP